ncbi:FHA domain-containing protein [Streptomyces sp. ISL-112]|uniref:FHA domain-containing protein n=1 Tax=unclassified Streptomyces TaxID=2593676 RepID=UPI001BE7AE1A|nr:MULTISPECIES: FHA domain-containing protein [unclassified Streptomyces]MBT2427174.1 FHA domain-containing protein [Streptomyces sp. ISL-112]MBT2461733.1 FHA domain-containing protein [Streptomyces sp. ISL-63]
MQIRLTVLAPRSGQTPARACDVLVTAPAGTALAAVASGLAQAVSGPEGSQGGGAVVFFAGRERLDSQRIALGEPPLVDGAVLSLQVPGEDEATDDTVPAQLHVVAGPDAGGVHLLHGGQIRIGRSAEADVPLDDPDVSRLHCAVTVSEDGRVSVADLGSTNGTTLDGAEVRDRPVRFPSGALLRLGESALRLTAGSRTVTLPTAPDGEGHLRVSRVETEPHAPDPAYGGPSSDAPRPQPVGYEGQGHGRGPASPEAAARQHAHGGREQFPEGGAGGREPFDPAGPRASGQERFGRGGQEPFGGGGQEPFRTGEAPRRGGIGAWARRLKGGGGSRGEQAPGAEQPGRGPWPEAGAAPSGHAHPPEAPGPDPYASPSPFASAGSFGDSGGHLASPASPQSPFSAVPSAPEGTWPDPAAVLLTALGPGPRLWERHDGHPEALVVRLGTTDRADVPSVPVTVGLREAGSLGLAGPRARLAGLARATVAQLAALHSPFDLEIVLISADRARSLEERRREWSWLGWLPHLRPMHGQDCRLLLAYDREQAAARTAELVRRLDDGPLGTGWPNLDHTEVADAARAHTGSHTVVILDGDPGTAALRETTARLAGAGAAAGIHLICLAETPAASPTSPVAATYDAACRASIAFRECGAVAMLSGDVATALRLLRTAGGQTAGHGTVAAVDAVSAAWAERFGRALAPLRDEGSAALAGRPTTAALPPSARLLDELGLARATPASLMARWASTAEHQPGASVPRATAAVPPSRADRETPGSVRTPYPSAGDRDSGRTLSTGPRVGPQRSAGDGHRSQEARGPVGTPYPSAGDRDSGRTRYPGAGAEDSGRTPYPSRATPRVGPQDGEAEAGRTPQAVHAGRPVLVLGAGPRGALCVDLADEGPHLLIEGPAGSGRTELLRAIAASLASSARPDRLGILLVDGAGGKPEERGGSAPGLLPCTELPHVFTHLVASDPVRMREFAQALGGELKRRAELLGPLDFAAWHARHAEAAQQEESRRIVGQRPPSGAERRGDLDSPASGTLRLRQVTARASDPGPSPLPRLVVLADDFDALVAPGLGSPGRPAAGSVVRALEAVARDGGRLGVHLVATSARPDRTEDTELARGARLRIVLDAPVLPPSPDEPAPGRGRLGHPDGRVTPFQGGRVTGRIPRTATLRPTVVPLEWERMGDPPTRRPVRELGNGPTDLALLASALERAARSVNAERLPPLIPFPT